MRKQREPNMRGGGRLFPIGAAAAAIALTACGPQSNAQSNQNAGGAASPSAAVARPSLPIAEGVWVDAAVKCNAAISAITYAGGHFGTADSSGAGAEPVNRIGKGRDGFITINDDVEEVKVLPNGQMVVRIYSLSQGEIERTTYRQCTPESLSPRMRAATAPLLGTFESIKEHQAPKWTVNNYPDGVTASVDVSGYKAYSGAPDAQRYIDYFALKCTAGRPAMNMTLFGGRAAQDIELVGAQSGTRVRERLQNKPDFVSNYLAPSASRETIALLTGSDKAVKVVMDGQEIGELPLREAAAAINSALRQCGGATAPQPATAASANFPPIPQGIYAGGLTQGGPTSCAQAIAAANRRENWPGDMLYSFTDKAWGSGFEYGSEFYEGSKIQRMETLGGNRYRLHPRGDQPLTVTVTGQGRFTMTAHGDNFAYTHCPDNTVPDWLRKHFGR